MLTLTGSCFSNVGQRKTLQMKAVKIHVEFYSFLCTIEVAEKKLLMKLQEAEEAVKDGKGWLNLDELKALVEESGIFD